MGKILEMKGVSKVYGTLHALSDINPQLGLHPALAVILSMAGCTLLGVLIDKVAYAPLRSAPRLSILITAIGVSYFLENGAQLMFGADAKVVPSYFDLRPLDLLGVSVSPISILTVVEIGRAHV